MVDKESERPASRRPELEGAPLAKLSMPRLASGIARPRLFKVLDEARQRAAAWIVAPGGAGKSTLVASYLLERNAPYIWYQLDKDDADPATFFYYLGIAAKQVSSDRGLTLPLLTPEYLPDIPGFARRYFGTLFTALPPATGLVLDNFQEPGESGILAEIMRQAIGEIPAGSNLFVISRSEPPSGLARHRTTGALEIIDWDTLRLTPEETRAIASRKQVLDANTIHALYERSDGWVAGLTLFLEQIDRKGPESWSIETGSLETIFNFFASEFFNDLPATTRDFLLKTAPLSHMTPRLAEQVGDNQDAGKILSEFHRRHFFINRRELDSVSYQYHALFREFLLSRLQETYSREQYMGLLRRTGRLLGEHHRDEEAVALYLRAQDWGTAGPLVLELAPKLLAQGRAQIVEGWIRQLPEALVGASGWLLYWRGISQLYLNPVESHGALEQAYERFIVDQDAIGQMLVASASIDANYFLRESLLLTVPWVNVIQGYLSSDFKFPTPEMEVHVLSSLLAALELMRPGDPELPRYADRLFGFLEHKFDVNHKVLLASRLLIYFAVIEGNAQACERIMLHVRSILDLPELAYPTRFLWKIMSVWTYLFTDSRSAVAAEAIDSLLTMRRGNGLFDSLQENDLSYLEFIASFYTSIVYLHVDDLDAVKTLLDRMEMLVTAPTSIDMAILLMVKCLYSLARDDRESAFKYGRESLEVHSSVGATITELDVACIIAIERCESGKPEEAFEYLSAPREIGFANSPRMRYQVLLIEAYACKQLGRQSECHDRLREAFNIGRDRHYFGNIFWLLRIMPPLCVEALQFGIEVDYVRRLIRMRQLLPEKDTIQDWPWSVRIHALGRFQVLIEDQTIAETKAQRRPLSLLEVIIALGGKDVRIDRVAEVLWPDAEGDAAISAFTTTISRLRKLIGAETIIIKNGRTSLDRRRCWVDAFALEGYLDGAGDEGVEPEELSVFVEKLLSLYRGPFLEDEEADWARPMRDRLCTKISRCLAHSAQVLSAAGKQERAADILERVMGLSKGLVSDRQGAMTNSLV